MPEITIKMAESDEEHDAARTLCREWLDWHWNAYPKDWPVEGNPMDPEKFEEILADLPQIHARPLGAILIAYVAGRPAGCVMYNQAQGQTSEFNRMFVSDNGRGHGIGRLLLKRMFQEMVNDGYSKVIFSSATFLTHARKMYQDAGFSGMPHPPGFPDEWCQYVYFMERDLLS